MNKVMRKIMNTILLLISAFVMTSIITGCSGSFDLQLEPQVQAYLSVDNKKPLSLSANDLAYQELELWLREHTSGWIHASGRYPGGVYIKSGDRGIQVAPQHLVIYDTRGTQPRAIYIQHIGPNELLTVKQLAAGS
jgi:hypothetical protein